MKLRCALGVLAVTGTARAADQPLAPPDASSVTAPALTPFEAPVRDVVVRGPVLPPALYPTNKNYWVAGIAVERFAATDDDVKSLDHYLVGVTGEWRLGPFAPHALFMMHPSREHENLRLLGGIGFRGYLDIPGFTTLSLGVGTHVEVRLEDHFWLWYLTPVELGAVVFQKRSFEVEVFLGLRRTITGQLINNFLFDPNGFDNDAAQDNLDRQTGADAWKGFLRVVFARRLD